jgi:hypothetical protein
MMDIEWELQFDVVEGGGRGESVWFGFGWGRGFFDGVAGVVVVFWHLVRDVVGSLVL